MRSPRVKKKKTFKILQNFNIISLNYHLRAQLSMTIVIENDLFNYSIMKTLQVKIHRENCFSNVFYNRGMIN